MPPLGVEVANVLKLPSVSPNGVCSSGSTYALNSFRCASKVGPTRHPSTRGRAAAASLEQVRRCEIRVARRPRRRSTSRWKSSRGATTAITRCAASWCPSRSPTSSRSRRASGSRSRASRRRWPPTTSCRARSRRSGSPPRRSPSRCASAFRSAPGSAAARATPPACCARRCAARSATPARATGSPTRARSVPTCRSFWSTGRRWSKARASASPRSARRRRGGSCSSCRTCTSRPGPHTRRSTRRAPRSRRRRGRAAARRRCAAAKRCSAPTTPRCSRR